MRAIFNYADHIDTRTLAIKKGIIGDEKTGAKSASYRKYAPVLVESGFECLPSVSITPSFMADFLKRIGASHEKPQDAEKAIEGSRVNKSELDALRSALEPFEGINVAVRSDECTAGGVGLWHTGFMTADNSSRGMLSFIKIIKRILKSEFSRDTVAFKTRAGLPMEEVPGAFIMPVVGMNLAMYPPAVCPAYHVNAITRFAGEEAMVNMGVGIGGANSSGAFSMLVNESMDFRPLDTQGVFLVSQNHAVAMYEGKMLEISEIPGARDSMLIKMEALSRLIGRNTSNLVGSLAQLAKKSEGSLYAELAFDGEWCALQCTETRLDRAVKPEIPNMQKIMNLKRSLEDARVDRFGSSVSGRKTIEATSIVYLPKDSPRHNREILEGINPALKNYAIITGMDMIGIGKRIGFASYSNAAAIISTEPSIFSISTHFNGAAREAGIIILNGKVNEKFIGGLKEGINQRKLLIYANDAKEEAFVAVKE